MVERGDEENAVATAKFISWSSRSRESSEEVNTGYSSGGGYGRTKIREGQHSAGELSGYVGKWNVEGGGMRSLGILQLSNSSYTTRRTSRPFWLGPNSHPASTFAPSSCF